MIKKLLLFILILWCPLAIAGQKVTGNLIVTGNVGVGSLLPGQTVDVNGTVRATSFLGDGSSLSGITASGWTDGGTEVFNTATSDNVGIGTTTTHARLEVQHSAGNEAFRISNRADGGVWFVQENSGNVGILTLAPSATLHVWQPDSRNIFKLSNSNGTVAMLVDSSGKVGIGLTPSVAFQVSSTMRSNALTGGGSGCGYIYTDTNGDLSCGSAAPLLTSGPVTFSGSNVGIGTASPMNTLQVNGTVQIDNVNSMGWTVVSAANQACNTTCTSACVMGEDTSVVGTWVACTDASADICLCAGPS